MSSPEKYLKPEVIRQVGRLDLRARFIVEGFLAGLHASPYHGFSVEFSEHRRYTPGDDVKDLDWTVYAKTGLLLIPPEGVIECRCIPEEKWPVAIRLAARPPAHRERTSMTEQTPPGPTEGPLPAQPPAVDMVSSTSQEEKWQLERDKILLDQYKVYVDSMEKVVARRQTTHSFFLSAHGILLTALGLIGKDLLTNRHSAIPVFVVAVVGSFLCYTWQQLCLWYGQLNWAKFEVIHALERQLPAQPFLEEWAVLKQGKDPKVFVPFSRTESVIPYLFYFCYIAAALAALIVAGSAVFSRAS